MGKTLPGPEGWPVCTLQCGRAAGQADTQTAGRGLLALGEHLPGKRSKGPKKSKSKMTFQIIIKVSLSGEEKLA